MTSRFDFIKGEMPRPARSNVIGSIVIVLVIATLPLVMVLPEKLGKPAVVLLAVFIPVAVASRSIYAVHITLFSLLWLSLLLLFPFFRSWPFHLLVPLITYGGIVGAIAFLRRSVTWLHFGHLGHTVRLLVAVTIIISVIALVIWYFAVRPDLNRYLLLLPDLPLWIFPFLAVGFAALNAAMEETIFRGIIMQAAESAMGIGYLSVIMQALSFGALHYRGGIPYGGWGVAMAFIYGIFLGVIRWRSRGLLAPWIAHVAANFAIFMLLSAIYFHRL